MTRHVLAAGILAILALPPAAAAGTAVEEARRCDRILAALSERRVDEAEALMAESSDPARQTDAGRVETRRKLDALLGYVFTLTGSTPLRREPVADSPVPGSDILIRREIWMFPGDKGMRLGCVRYEAGDGWVTQVQLGDSMEAVTALLEQNARLRVPAPTP